MMKKLQNISWGVWAAIAGLMVFIGLAVIPDIRAVGSTEKPKKGNSLLGMMAEAEKKSQEQKEHKNHGAKEGPKLEIKSIHAGAGAIFLGGKNGLLRVEKGAVKALDYPGYEAKSLTKTADGTLLVAAKDGLWRLAAGSTQWQRVHEAEAQSVTVSADGMTYLVTKKAGILQSNDLGKSWSPVSWTLPDSAYEAKEKEHKDHSSARNDSADEKQKGMNKKLASSAVPGHEAPPAANKP